MLVTWPVHLNPIHTPRNLCEVTLFNTFPFALIWGNCTCNFCTHSWHHLLQNLFCIKQVSWNNKIIAQPVFKDSHGVIQFSNVSFQTWRGAVLYEGRVVCILKKPCSHGYCSDQFANKLNKAGPKIKPCGTLNFTLISSNVLSRHLCKVSSFMHVT